MAFLLLATALLATVMVRFAGRLFPLFLLRFSIYFMLRKKSEIEELCSLHTDYRNNVRHDRVSCPTKTPARRGVPCENRIPNSRTLGVISVFCYTPHEMRTRDDTGKLDVRVH